MTERFWSQIGRLLTSSDNVRSLEEFDPSFAAPWAQQGPAWVVFGCLALLGLSFWFYLRHQHRGRAKSRTALAVARGVLLCLLLILLADPVLNFVEVSQPKPVLWVMVDGTDSMGIEDRLPQAEKEALGEAVGQPPISQDLARIDYVKSLLTKKDDNLLKKLDSEYDLKVFLMDQAEGARELTLSSTGSGSSRTIDTESLTSKLTTQGDITDLGAAFDNLANRQSLRHLAGLVVFSDFNDTTDFSQEDRTLPVKAAERLHQPVYAVGVGPVEAVDLAVAVQPPPVMKKDERSNVVVALRHTGLDGKNVNVKLFARQLSGDQGASDRQSNMLIETKSVTLGTPPTTVEFNYTPTKAGRFMFSAEVEPMEGEVVTDNNRHEREVQIRDDFMRLLYVEEEPTWEWRFIKEVFHRDKLVGLRGFRTHLRSSDPQVRESNELFLKTLTPPRSEFFANDVILIGDMKATSLTTTFCNLAKEFVGEFGGGLVVICGPRFGAAELAQTPLADMLPVVLDPNRRLADERSFELQINEEESRLFSFMRLGQGDNSEEHAHAWKNMGKLPWYQPVERLHPIGSFALAQHPTDTCVDGKNKQPIIAIRNYGRGQVVWLGFDETWRLRRKYGEVYYRQFWAQMIHHLGLRHAMGDQKRFVVRVDKPSYKANDELLMTVEAYDENYRPLSDARLKELGYEDGLVAEWSRPDSSGEKVEGRKVPLVKDGLYEQKIHVFQEGEHQLRVKDPISGNFTSVTFKVSKVSNERRHATRDFRLQQRIADATKGKAYDLTNVSNVVNDIHAERITERTPRQIPLWDTWLCFGVVAGLMLTEWFARKAVNLP